MPADGPTQEAEELGKLRHLETHTLWVQEKVRSGQIQVRKVRGGVNPADLFTKYLPSSVKINQLVKLFGCEYREGRSAVAPLLRPHGSSGGQGGQPLDSHLPTFPVTGAASDQMKAHDETRLPHMYSDEDIAKLFPLITAPPMGENVEDWQPAEQPQEDGGDAAASACGSRMARPPGSKQ